MNPNEIEGVWNSKRNDLATDRRKEMARLFTERMTRRRRFEALWLGCTFALLLASTALAVRAIAGGKVDFETQWGLFPLLCVPWAFAFHFLRRFLKPGAAKARGEMPLGDSLRAALEANRTQRAHLKLVGVLFAIMVPILWLSMQQLLAAGKISARELGSMRMFFGAVLLVSAAAVAARYFVRVKPEENRLTSLLEELKEESGGGAV